MKILTIYQINWLVFNLIHVNSKGRIKPDKIQLFLFVFVMGVGVVYFLTSPQPWFIELEKKSNIWVTIFFSQTKLSHPSIFFDFFEFSKTSASPRTFRRAFDVHQTNRTKAIKNNHTKHVSFQSSERGWCTRIWVNKMKS